MSNELYYRGSGTYEATVTNQLNQLQNSNISLRNSMRNMEYGIRSDIRASTYAIVASQQMLADTFQDGFDSVNNTLDAGIGQLSASLASLENSITEMGAKICDKLDEIHDIVNNPLLTQSRELYRRALLNFQKGYYEEALEDCTAAVEKNKTDYISWNLLGQIYLFGAGKFSNVINIDKAEESFTNAAKYIDADIDESYEAKLLASEIYYYLGYTKLLQSNDYLVESRIDESNKKLTEAENHSEYSYQLSKNNILAAYEQAKELHFLDKDDESLAVLEEIFRKEPVFAVKASNDKNFESIWNRIDKLVEKLRDENVKQIHEKYDSIFKSANQQIANLKNELEKLDIPPKETFDNKLDIQFTIERELEEKNILDEYDYNPEESNNRRIGTAYEIINMYRKSLEDAKKEGDAKMIAELENSIKEHQKEIAELEQKNEDYRAAKQDKEANKAMLKKLSKDLTSLYAPTKELFYEKCDNAIEELKSKLAKFNDIDGKDYLSSRKILSEIQAKSVQEWVNPIINPLKETLKEFKILINAASQAKIDAVEDKKNSIGTIVFFSVFSCIALIGEFVAVNIIAMPLSLVAAILIFIFSIINASFLAADDIEKLPAFVRIVDISVSLASLIMVFIGHPVIGLINAIGAILPISKKNKLSSIVICIICAVCTVGLFITGHWIMGIIQSLVIIIRIIISMTWSD